MKKLIKFIFWVVVICGIIAGAGKLFLFDIYTTDSNSMAPTLIAGDTFLLLKHFNPTTGSIVVCQDPRNTTRNIVGRIAGLPGEKVEIINSSVFINGYSPETTTEGSYLFVDTTKEKNNTYDLSMFMERLGGHYFNILVNEKNLAHKSIRTSSKSYVVKNEHWFLVGDNRPFATDSRIYGQVLQDSCKGIAFFIIKAAKSAGSAIESKRRFSFVK